MFEPLSRYWGGYLLIEITGGEPEALVNLAAFQGITFWNVCRHGGALRAETRLVDFFRLRTPCRRTRCRVRIRRRSGFPFHYQRTISRQGMVAGFVLAMAAIFWITAHIWVVEVRGTELIDPRAVQSALAEIGLRPGIWRARAQLGVVEHELPLRLPAVSWATVRMQGTRVVVDVVEKVSVRQPPTTAERVDIVAGAPAVIADVLVLRGYPRVKPGDVVAPGQLLVEGVVWAHGAPVPVLPGVPKPPPDRAVRLVAADARVMGRRWYREYIELPRRRDERVPTGRTATSWILRLGQREFFVKGSAMPPYDQADMQSRTWAFPQWRSWKLPVELTSRIAVEVSLRQQEISLEEAKAAITQRLVERVRWRLTVSDRVVSVQTEVLRQTPELVGIEVTVETIEDIGRPQESQAGLPGPLPGLESAPGNGA